VGFQNTDIERCNRSVAGQSVCYLRAGSGPPLLLIHGLLGGAFCWRLNLPAFAQRFTTYALDLPGCGESADPVNRGNGGCGMTAQADYLASFLSELALSQVDVVASSWGGGVAQLFAARYPARLRSLVLVSPVNPWSDLGRERVRFFSRRVGAALLRVAMPFSRPVHLWALERMYGDPARMPAGALEGYSRLFLRKGLAGNIVKTLRAWEDDMEELRRAPEQIHSPTLLVWGARDGAVDPESAQILLRRLRQGELTVIDGAGHLLFEEVPEEFNRLTLDFLESPRSP
jgi:pimeloyl-ACP methyl ester carboxylesterase